MPTRSFELRRFADSAAPGAGGVLAVMKVIREKFAEQGWQGVVSGLARCYGILMTLGRHRELVKVIDGPVTRVVRLRFPRVQYRYTLPYLSNRFDWDERWNALKSHYAFINQVFKPEFMKQVMDDTLVVWRMDSLGQTLSVSVQGLCAQTRHREGELTLCCRFGGSAVYKLSFSVIRLDTCRAMARQSVGRGSHVLYVGRVQGVAGQRDAIRQASSMLGDVAPQDLLMAVLSGVAAALGIQTLIGVDDGGSLSGGAMSHAHTSFSYAAFWSRYGAQPLRDGHVLVSLPIYEKPLSEIPSKHRKRSLRKRALKRDVAVDACEAIRALMF